VVMVRNSKSFDLSKIWAKAQKFGHRCFDIFLPMLMRLYFFIIERINKSLLCHRKHIKYI